MKQNIEAKAERVCTVFEFSYNFTVYYNYDVNDGTIEFRLCHNKFNFVVTFTLEKFFSMTVQRIIEELYGMAKEHIWDWYGLK